MEITIIGDVHCKIDKYFNIIQNIKKSIQVGDFGFRKEHEWHLQNIDSSNHKIVFGNHDDYNFLNEKHSLKNWSYENNIFTIRGAESIDRYRRTEGVDYFSNEELNYTEFDEVIENYINIKPKIVISHDCPKSICTSLFGIHDKNITRSGLDALFEIHKPDIWIFGHHHRSINTNILKTNFICLKELETYKLVI